MTTLLLLLIICWGCSKEDIQKGATQNLTIFFVDDVHAQIDNFPKVKHIIDTERKITNVIVASDGDLFSGNPVVDSYAKKGYPIIDIMNDIGFIIVFILVLLCRFIVIRMGL